MRETSPESSIEDKTITQDVYDAQVNGFLQGKVLTIIDASIHDERANKAMKDLIKGVFRTQYIHIFDMFRGASGSMLSK